MKLTYLGTGAAEGMPATFCSCPTCMLARKNKGKNIKMRSCALVDDCLLLDISPDIFSASLQHCDGLLQVANMLVTHTHSDHLNLFALMLRARDGASIRQDLAEADNYLTIYGSKAVKQAVEQAFVLQPYANKARIRFQLIENGVSFQVAGYQVTPFQVIHKQDEACFIYAIEKNGQILLYANDMGALAENGREALQKFKGCFSVVSTDCACGMKPGNSHMGIAECIAFRDFLRSNGQVGGNTRFLLNHISHMAEMTHDELAQAVQPYGFEVTYDGMFISTTLL